MGIDVVSDYNCANLYSNSESVSNWLWSDAPERLAIERSIPEDLPQDGFKRWPASGPSPPRQSRLRHSQDVDQSSTVSVDDSLSLSDSTQESYSSEYTAPTSWTSNTGSADQFPDDDDFQRETCPPHDSHRQGILAEQVLNGLSANDSPNDDNSASATSDRCPFKLATKARNQLSSLKLYKQIGFPCVKSACTKSSTETSQPELQRTNARRSNCPSRDLMPPALKRDTVSTDDFVNTLIIFATRLVMTIWPFSSATPRATSCYNGNSVLPLRVFIQETLRRSKTSYSTLQVALYYLVLLKDRLPKSGVDGRYATPPEEDECSWRSRCRAMNCGRRMFLAALMLASKYLQDRNYSTRAWSKISGLRSNEINDNEREYLMRINYDLHLPKHCFDNWNRVVLALCKFTKISKSCCAPLSPASADRFSGNGSSQVLADMVSQVALKESHSQESWFDDWWYELVMDLDPTIVKDTKRTTEFLTGHLPELAKRQPQLAQLWDTCASQTTGHDLPSFPDDVSISESLRAQGKETPRSQPSPTPIQMSPAPPSGIPLQPKLRNLPTPQSTPRVNDSWSGFGGHTRPSLRCSASMGALRNIQRQCLMNATLDRCPPPRPQMAYSHSNSLMRPAVTPQEPRSKENIPLTSSPLSVVSEVTNVTSRSRSSSISSNSSWSSLSSGMSRPKLPNEGQFSSPLAKVSSIGDRPSRTGPGVQSMDIEPSYRTSSRANPLSSVFMDEGYGSSEEPLAKSRRLISETEASAINALLAMSTQDESSSQSVTPKPNPRTLSQINPKQHVGNEMSRGHKRSLSKVASHVQDQVRRTLFENSMSCEAVDDEDEPPYDSKPREWQSSFRAWADPRQAVPNATDTKRFAAYKTLQQIASAPDLASQYLRDSMFAVSLPDAACTPRFAARSCAVPDKGTASRRRQELIV